jgi:hypothetical protein
MLAHGNGHAVDLERDVRAGKYFLCLANRRIRQILAALTDNDDAMTTATADALLNP